MVLHLFQVINTVNEGTYITVIEETVDSVQRGIMLPKQKLCYRFYHLPLFQRPNIG